MNCEKWLLVMNVVISTVPSTNSNIAVSTHISYILSGICFISCWIFVKYFEWIRRITANSRLFYCLNNQFTPIRFIWHSWKNEVQNQFFRQIWYANWGVFEETISNSHKTAYNINWLFDLISSISFCWFHSHVYSSKSL